MRTLLSALSGRFIAIFDYDGHEATCWAEKVTYLTQMCFNYTCSNNIEKWSIMVIWETVYFVHFKF